MKFKGIRDVILDSNGNVSYPKNVHPKVNFKVKVDTLKVEKLCTNSTFTSVRANYKNGDSKIIRKISLGDEESFEVWGCQEYFDIYDLCEKLNNEDKKEKKHQTPSHNRAR